MFLVVDSPPFNHQLFPPRHFDGFQAEKIRIPGIDMGIAGGGPQVFWSYFPKPQVLYQQMDASLPPWHAIWGMERLGSSQRALRRAGRCAYGC